MKKCPYCAEEVQDEALKCKHCKSFLTSQNTIAVSPPPPPIIDKYPKNNGHKKTLRIIGIIFLVILGSYLWFLSVPAIILWWLWKKGTMDKKKKYIYSGITLAISLVIWITLGVAYAESNKPPKLTVTEPATNFTIQAKSIIIKGSVIPTSSVVMINNKQIITDKDGNFQNDFALNNEQNNILIVATRNNKITSTTLLINRIFTDEEKAEIAKEQAEKEAKLKEQLEAKAKAEKERVAAIEAEEKAWKQTKAGQICNSRYNILNNWTKDECEKLANGKIWIGMSIGMLKAVRGLPNAANPSDYGYGKQWQWCWYDYSPSCFYDDNDDGIIDSYN